MPDRLVGVREAAPRFNMHWKTLQKRCCAGTSPVPARLTSGGWVMRASDIDRYIVELFSEDIEVGARE